MNSVTANHHVALLDPPVAQLDFNSISILYYSSDGASQPDVGLVWQAIVENAKVLAALQEQDIMAVAISTLETLSFDDRSFGTSGVLLSDIVKESAV
jgi:hypothetical protein